MKRDGAGEVRCTTVEDEGTREKGLGRACDFEGKDG